ncbi:TIGR02588 family protein [Rhizobium sp. CG5]|uniref:TIGR02588 family protein n=1 Tax=Rhizobium sp. CG5 TaxID=2726076 RepID=UPI002033DA11|nr:TIGR02588 family protein [Rhizobium sp. CG5]MCM2472011.1 TIGR02588 family protein [Rhizobium sp. CG5]
MTTVKSGHSTEYDQPHWIEWVAGMLSLVLILAIIGWVGYEAVTRTDETPELSVTLLGTDSGPTGHRVTFEVENISTATAAAVVLHGEITDNGEVVEEAEVTFDYVPSQSKAGGALIFQTDPTGKQVTIRPVGFTDP